MAKQGNLSDEILFNERLTSKRTQALFIILTILFLLFFWRIRIVRFDLLAGAALTIAVLFLFYVFNYRELVIQLNSEVLKLKFGIFSWRVSLENIASCREAEMPALMQWGGAGIHFMFIRKRYRVMFNFLEYPRVVVLFKKKVGPVWEICFSTRRAKEIIQLLEKEISVDTTAESMV